MSAHYSEDQTRAVKISYAPYFNTLYKIQPKESMKISTITPYVFFIMAVNSSKCQTRSEIGSCTPYSATP